MTKMERIEKIDEYEDEEMPKRRETKGIHTRGRYRRRIGWCRGTGACLQRLCLLTFFSKQEKVPSEEYNKLSRKIREKGEKQSQEKKKKEKKKKEQRS